MPKEKLTPEQKSAARSLKLQTEADAKIKYDFQRAAALAEYKAALPKRLLDAHALASSLCVATHVELTATGPSVRFEHEDHSKKLYLDSTLTYESESWEVESVEDWLKDIKHAKEESERRLQCAKSAWSNLEEDQRSCIKEFIHSLK
jgi:hypothetical protein